ncbi:glutaredoxin [Sporodiniella umbellata]|nr:glutaredoxin [Sporodiniella umbellata]
MAEVQQIVEKIISENKVAVFSKSYCPYCTKAKEALTKLGLTFFSIELDKEANGSEIQAYLQQKTGQRTVPNIFVNEDHIGGCDDLLKAISAGKVK